MSSKEAIQNLLRRGNEPRAGMRMGAKDAFWHETLMKWEAEGHIQRTTDRTDIFYEDQYDLSAFGFDMYGVGGYFDELPLRGWREVVEETDDWVAAKNGGGATLRYFKQKSGVPEHIAFEMTTPEIWAETYRPHLLQLDRERLSIEQDKAQLEKYRGQGVFTYYGHKLYWEVLRETMGDVCMLESVILEPEWIDDFCRVYTDFYKMHFKVLFEEAGVPDGVWFFEDLGYKNGLFCSPAMLEELFFPYYREIVDFIHGYGIPVIFHSCGNITKALPMIVKAGFDALNPIEVKAGCDVLAFAEEYGDQLAFIGGVDARFFESHDRAQIRREIEVLTKQLKARGARYIFSSDHSISPAVEYGDYLYALEVFRENAAY